MHLQPTQRRPDLTPPTLAAAPVQGVHGAGPSAARAAPVASPLAPPLVFSRQPSAPLPSAVDVVVGLLESGTPERKAALVQTLVSNHTTHVLREAFRQRPTLLDPGLLVTLGLGGAARELIDALKLRPELASTALVDELRNAGVKPRVVDALLRANPKLRDVDR